MMPSSRPSTGLAAGGAVKALGCVGGCQRQRLRWQGLYSAGSIPTKEKSEANQKKELCRDLGVTRASLAAGLRLLCRCEEHKQAAKFCEE